MRIHRLIVCGTGATLAAGTVALAFPVELRWAGDQDSDKVDALGAPDGVTSVIGLNETVTFAAFGALGATGIDTTDIAAITGADFGIVEGAEFVAFECNGAPGIGFEDSTWVFSDGENTETYTVETAWFATTASVDGYAALFGLETSCAGDIPVVLFNLDVVDPLSPDFAVSVTGGSAEPGSPDPDAMAVLAPPACPEDIDGSGVIDSADLNIVLANFGCIGPACPGDVNASFGTDSADLNAVLALFGQACD